MSVTKDAAIDRFNKHSTEVSTLYPHHGTHGLALPFGWTKGVPTKPSYYHALSRATPTISLSGLGLGWPRVYQRHQRPSSWQNGPKRGQGTIKPKMSTQGYVCLPGQGMHAHNLPSREAPARCTTKDRIKTFPQGKCGRTE